MDLSGWDERYRSDEPAGEPVPLLVETASALQPGTALDLACGSGRNAVWLAVQGWSVTAIDGAPAAIDLLRRRDAGIEALVADLEKAEYRIEPSSWDLVVISYYLQRDLIGPAKAGVKPGGVLLAIVLLTRPGEEPTYKRAKPGELQTYFLDWEILHYREGNSTAEIVARRPKNLSST
jgi:tellurite methyltransferase